MHRWQRGPMQWIANPQNRRFESYSVLHKQKYTKLLITLQVDELLTTIRNDCTIHSCQQTMSTAQRKTANIETTLLTINQLFAIIAINNCSLKIEGHISLFKLQGSICKHKSQKVWVSDLAHRESAPLISTSRLVLLLCLHIDGAIVYRLGHQVFILRSGVRLPVALPSLSTLMLRPVLDSVMLVCLWRCRKIGNPSGL